MRIRSKLGELLHTDALLPEGMDRRDLDQGSESMNTLYANSRLPATLFLWLMENPRSGRSGANLLVHVSFTVARGGRLVVQRSPGGEVLHFEVEPRNDGYWMVERQGAGTRRAWDSKERE